MFSVFQGFAEKSPVVGCRALQKPQCTSPDLNLACSLGKWVDVMPSQVFSINSRIGVWGCFAYCLVTLSSVLCALLHTAFVRTSAEGRTLQGFSVPKAGTL